MLNVKTLEPQTHYQTFHTAPDPNSVYPLQELLFSISVAHS
jgi:hypothetical protein